MRFFLDKIAKLNIGWNERALDEADFYRLCRRFRITVVKMPLSVGGFYFRLKNKDYIVVDEALKSQQKLIVLFHELGHFLFHVPETGATANFHGRGCESRQETEADAFALCAVMPKSWLERRPVEELVLDDGFSYKMIEGRFRILSRYGF